MKFVRIVVGKIKDFTNGKTLSCRQERIDNRENRRIRREHGLEDYESDTPHGYYT